MRSLAAPIALLVAAALAACGSASRSADTSDLVPTGATCRPLTAAVPALDALIDPAAAAGILQQVPRFALVYDIGAERPVVQLYGAPDTLAGAVVRAALPQRGARESWGVRIVRGADGRAMTEPALRCAPRPLGAPSPVAVTMVSRAGSPPQLPRFEYEGVIDRNGYVKNLTVTSGTPGDAGQQILNASARVRYEPARIEGVPVAAVHRGRVG